MPALNFQARFAPLVESGEKRQTIRARRKDGRDPKPGDTLYLYTGMRTKACRRLAVAKCAKATPITLDADSGRLETIRLSPYDLDRLSRNDGFDGYREMAAWFEATHGLPFSGLLIQWYPLPSEGGSQR